MRLRVPCRRSIARQAGKGLTYVDTEALSDPGARFGLGRGV